MDSHISDIYLMDSNNYFLSVWSSNISTYIFVWPQEHQTPTFYRFFILAWESPPSHVLHEAGKSVLLFQFVTVVSKWRISTFWALCVLFFFCLGITVLFWNERNWNSVDNGTVSLIRYKHSGPITTDLLIPGFSLHGYEDCVQQIQAAVELHPF